MLEAIGPGTRRLAELAEGDALWLTGPLGIGFSAPAPGPAARRALLTGGGVGVPPLAAWARQLDPRPVALLGFRDAATRRAPSSSPAPMCGSRPTTARSVTTGS